MDDEDHDRTERRDALERRLQSRRDRDRRLLVVIVIALAGLIAGKIALDLQTNDGAPAENRAGAPTEPTTRTRRSRRVNARARTLAAKRPDFVLEDGKLFWTDGKDARYRVVELISRGPFAIETSAGRLRLEEAVWQASTAGPTPELLGLIDRARHAGLPLADAIATQTDGPLHLKANEFRVLPGGVIRRDPTLGLGVSTDSRNAREHLLQAAARFIEGLDEAPIDEATRLATATLLDGLRQSGGNHFADLKPTVTRRLIRHGWLRHLGMPEAKTRALEGAVASALALRPTRGLKGPGGSFIRYTDAFGRKVEILTCAEGTWYTCQQPGAQWLGSVAQRSAVIQLPPGSDPLTGHQQPIAATLRLRGGAHVLASWKAGGTLETDEPLWQRYVSGKIGNRKNTPASLFPPHILISDIHGDAVQLVTAHGVVRPAADGSDAETQRFFDECALALPDAAHMDLVGEILYDYAWDTAEYDRPLLIGTETYNGDIHQTATQTLGTCCGGLYRGDCDDLACFFHALTTHQGRNAHVLSLPHHLANAYAEKESDGTWVVSVLHTGPPIEVRASTLDGALRKTYEHFDSHESIDLNALPISLRFGGDAVRERYLLPAEIFADRSYALGMVAVQAAYRFHTYLSGIETMIAIRDARKAPTAGDHREVAHLMRWANRYADAVVPFEKALEASKEPASRVDAALDLLTTLVKTGPRSRITALATRLEEDLIPAFEHAQRGRLLQPWLRLANALLASDHHKERGLGILANQARRSVEPSLGAIEELAARKGFNPRWLHYRGMPRHTTNATTYVNAALRGLRETRAEPSALTRGYRTVVERLVTRWFLKIAVRTTHGNARILTPYAALADFYETRLGDDAFAKLVADAGPPGVEDVQRAALPAGIGATPPPAALRIIHIAPGYRRTVWWRHFVAEGEAFDAGATKRGMYAELMAIDAAAQLGQAHHSDPTARLFVRLALAVLAGNPEALRPILAEVAARKDHRLRDRVAALMGAAARRHPVGRWRALLEVWADALDHAPHYFEVAWIAQRAELPAHAAAAARLAVARHPDRPAFVRELKHLGGSDK